MNKEDRPVRYYCAPMEGVTGYLYRAAHHRYFSGVDKYFMPFLTPTQNPAFTRRQLQELAPEHNRLVAVPQLLTRRAEDFIWAANALGDMGYGEVNLNLGCPSGTVVSKGKGAGFLALPEELDRFLDEVFSAVTVPISVKTRLGVEDPAEFEALLEIYNRYPIAELTVHTRVRQDFYRHSARPQAVEGLLERSRAPVCYNGDLFAPKDVEDLTARFPTVGAVMAGRGLMADPALFAKARGGAGADRECLRAFHDTLFEGYAAAFGSRRNAMLRMKEVWFYLLCLFGDHQDYAKRLRKCTDPAEFAALSAGIFRDLPLLERAAPEW